MNTGITLLILLILLLCTGFFTSAETAYLSLTKTKLRTLLDKKARFSAYVAKLKADMDRLLTTVLIGTNFLTSLSSALATALAIRVLGERAVAYIPFVTAFFITVFAQIIPKTAAGLYPEFFTSFESVPLLLIERLFFPVIWLFTKLSHAAVAIIEKIIRPSDTIITEDELKTLIDVGKTEGTLEEDESRMLNKIIQFNGLHASGILKHRAFVSMIDLEATHDEVVQEFISSGFSTLTVYRGTKENVVGVIHYKDVLFSSKTGDTGKGYAGRIMSEVLFVPETIPVLELLRKFRADEYKFAVVLNEHGQTEGIITMEDIVRVIFGRMTDENSYDSLPPENKIQPVSPDTFLVPGEMKLDDVNEILSLTLESEEFTTLGGWLLEQFGSLPSPGETLIHGKTIFTAEDVFQRRIVTVRIKTG